VPDIIGQILSDFHYLAMKKVHSISQQSIEKVREVAAIREDYIQRKGQPLSIKHLCHKRGLYSTTVKRLAPELYENWYDINFHWK
jgi:hypothetical protein